MTCLKKAVHFSWICSLVAALVLMLSPQEAAANYKVAPGDQLRIEVLEDSALNRTVLVLPDGSISFPFVGTIRAGGRTVGAIQNLLSQRLADNFAAPPTVFVNVGALAPPSQSSVLEADPYGIFMMGEVNTPGRLEIDDDESITLLQAIAQAGGFTRFAATKRIELRRHANGGERIYVYNYKQGGGISGATKLYPGDVIVVPERRLFE